MSQLEAGYQKLWGSENAACWNGGGAAVKGVATAGITGSAAGKGGASYGWWAGFLHNFVVPNASWIAKLVAVGEVATRDYLRSELRSLLAELEDRSPTHHGDGEEM